MPNENQRVLEFTKDFKADLKSLSKKYRRIRSDLHPLLTLLQNGETPGDRVQGTGYIVHKTRLASSDARRGKSGGYRVIYQVKGRKIILLLTIYAKSDQQDVSSQQIIEVIKRNP